MALSIYNEQNYLFNPDVIPKFEEKYEQKRRLWDQEKEVFHDTLKKYDDYIAEVAELLHHLGYSSALECSLLISYLIESGVLSNEYIFIDQVPDSKKEIHCRLGTTIVTGAGCCRNYACFLKDIFDCMHIPTDYFYCYQGIPRIGFEKKANHVINLIRHEENVYGIDLYNGNRLYHFKTPFIQSEVAKRPFYQLLYKPYFEITMGEATLEQIKQRIKRFQDYSTRPIINPTEYKDTIRSNARKKAYENHDALYEFHDKTKTLKKEIVQDIHRVYH